MLTLTNLAYEELSICVFDKSAMWIKLTRELISKANYFEELYFQINAQP